MNVSCRDSRTAGAALSHSGAARIASSNSRDVRTVVLSE